jgi:hypothetical protein
MFIIEAIYWKPSVIIIFLLLYDKVFDQLSDKISFKIKHVEYFVFLCVVLFYVVAFASLLLVSSFPCGCSFTLRF